MNNKLSDFGVEFNKSKLENGINVFGFFRIGMPICVRVVFFAGSRFDTVQGTAHFLEHMLVAGTEKFPSKDKLAEPLEKIGGGFSASTSIDCMRLNISVSKKEDLNIGLEILGEMLERSLFEEKTIENERGSIISEIGADEEDPYYMLNDTYYHMAFKGTVLVNNITGSEDSVKNIRKQDLLKFKNDFLNAGRMCILISGDVAVNEYMPLLNKYFSNYQPQKYFIMPEIAKINRQEFIGFKPFKDNKRIYAKIGFRTIGMNENDKEMFSLDLIADILGKGRASRLLKELRYKKGLVYGAGANNYNYSDSGHFSVSTSFGQDKLENVIETIINELRKLERDGMSKDELEFGKSAIVKSSFNNMQTSMSWINVHEDEMIFNPELSRTLDYAMNGINSLTLEEVNATVKKYLRKDNFYLALCGVDEKPSVAW